MCLSVIVVIYVVLCFFKQKTADEMRISDWSSDVCSSDLLDPHSGEPSVRVYDTSGPYPDANTSIDINAGLPELRAAWIRSRGDVEEVSQREVRPEDNGQLGPDRSGGVPAFPAVRKTVLRARGGANVSQMHYARKGIITPEMDYVATRENLGRERLADYKIGRAHV